MINPADATHYQPHQKAFYKEVDKVFFVWSQIENEGLHWIMSPATSEKFLIKLS